MKNLFMKKLTKTQTDINNFVLDHLEEILGEGYAVVYGHGIVRLETREEYNTRFGVRWLRESDAKKLTDILDGNLKLSRENCYLFSDEYSDLREKVMNSILNNEVYIDEDTRKERINKIVLGLLKDETFFGMKTLNEKLILPEDWDTVLETYNKFKKAINKRSESEPLTMEKMLHDVAILESTPELITKKGILRQKTKYGNLDEIINI